MLHLEGNNAPVREESTILDGLRVVGKLPPDLHGRFYRNGPNPSTGWSPHLFAGDGMVHGIAIEDGRARWYRNRYVRTPLFAQPERQRTLDPTLTTANTHVIEHAGRLLALEEGGLPYELSPVLDTVGPHDFGGALHGPMTAHPKTCPTTGDLLFFGYSLRPPHLTYYRADGDGRIVRTRVVDVPRATMMHDFAVTASHAIFHDSPVVFDASLIPSGAPPWRWDDDHGARFGVIDRDGAGTDVRWFEIEPCHLSHAMNAYEIDDDTIVLTGCRIESLWRAGSLDLGGDLPRLHRWVLDLTTGTTTETPLDDATTDYPRVRDPDVGLPHRHGWSTDFVMEAEPEHGEIYRYDVVTGDRATHRFPSGHTCGEPVPVADGYVLTFAHDRGTGTSYLAVLDADDLDAAPVAEVHVPVRIPAGFHGSWVSD
jgi:carotenoid cleavage dioxygenase